MKKENIEIAILKMNTTPYSLINDSLDYRCGYIRCLTDLGIIDGLTASRMLIEIASKDEWHK